MHFDGYVAEGRVMMARYLRWSGSGSSEVCCPASQLAPTVTMGQAASGKLDGLEEDRRFSGWDCHRISG
jgi:hypothetical protein